MPDYLRRVMQYRRMKEHPRLARLRAELAALFP